jgi:hypothetical protein
VKSNYDKFPTTNIEGFDEQAFQGWDSIREQIENRTDNKRAIIVVECYQGLYHDELIPELSKMTNCTLQNVMEVYKDPAQIHDLVYPEITDDPIFGKLTKLSLEDFFDESKKINLQESIRLCRTVPLAHPFHNIRWNGLARPT